MSTTLQKPQRSFSLQKFSLKSSERHLTPEKSKQIIRNRIKDLRSSKFSQMFTKRNHNDVLYSDYRDLRFASAKKTRKKSSSIEKEGDLNEVLKVPISKIVIKRKRTLKHFDNLIEKCEKAQKSYVHAEVVSGDCTNFTDAGRLKRTIERFQVLNNDKLVYSKTEKLLKNDSKVIRGEIGYSEQIKNQKSCIWKQRSGFLNRRTDKLIANIAIRLKQNKGFD